MRTWYEFKASSDGQKETTLFLYDEIGGFGKSAANFINDLQAVPSDHRLVLRIHSPGGSVLDGNAIFTALKAHPGGVTTHIDGLAASMASVVAIAGDPVRMAGNGLMMIHNVNGGVSGDADDLRKMADTMDKVQQTIENAYVGKTGLSRKKIKEMMDAETWMTASEAEDLGFVDEITGDLEMAASFDRETFAQFKNAPSDLIQMFTNVRPTKKESGHDSPPKGYPKDKEHYADPANYKYPIDTEEHVRAAWSYIHQARNRKEYTSQELSYIEGRIRGAAKRFGIKLEEDKKKNDALTSLEAAMATLKEQLEASATRVSALEADLSASTSKISELEAENNELTVKITSAEIKISETEKELSGLATQYEAANSKIFVLEGEKAKLAVEFKAATDEITALKASAKSADERAREIAARNGANLPKKDLKVGEFTGTGDAKTMTRADFSNLRPGERMAFIKQGGRLTD